MKTQWELTLKLVYTYDPTHPNMVPLKPQTFEEIKADQHETAELALERCEEAMWPFQADKKCYTLSCVGMEKDDAWNTDIDAAHDNAGDDPTG
jgi:hypothetical protein